MTTGRQCLAELVGTALLVATVVGSGIAATRLTDVVGLQLLATSLATGAVLVALILALGATSAHFNPVVTLVALASRRMDPHRAVALVAAQLVGGGLGAILANLMFDLDAVSIAGTDRGGAGRLLAEVVATFGLVLVILGADRRHRDPRPASESSTANAELPVALAVGGYITAAYWFTSSTSFANPAVTAARTLSDTFAGISPGSVPPFIGMQVLGGLLALVVAEVLAAPDHRLTQQEAR